MLLQHLAHVHAEYVPERHAETLLSELCICDFTLVEREGYAPYDGVGWDETTTVIQVVHAPGCTTCTG